MNSDALIYTLGHGGRTVDEALRLLAVRRVDMLVDVRSAPYSRFQPAFSKRPLAEACAEASLTYVFKGDGLGGRPDDPSCVVGGVVQYDLARTRAEFQRGLDWLVEQVSAGRRLGLLCGERRPHGCHRALLVGEALSARTIAVLHIDEEDHDVAHEALMAMVRGGQRALF